MQRSSEQVQEQRHYSIVRDARPDRQRLTLPLRLKSGELELVCKRQVQQALTLEEVDINDSRIHHGLVSIQVGCGRVLGRSGTRERKEGWELEKEEEEGGEEQNQQDSKSQGNRHEGGRHGQLHHEDHGAPWNMKLANCLQSEGSDSVLK